MTDKKINQAKKVIVVGLLLLSLVFTTWFLVYIAFALALIFLVSKKAGNFIVKWWFKFAEVLGWINSRILLTLIYFLILVPTAMLRKIVGKQTLMLKKPKKSTFVSRNHTYVPKDLKYGW